MNQKKKGQNELSFLLTFIQLNVHKYCIRLRGEKGKRLF